MLKTTEKQQTLKAAVLSAVMVMSAIGMNVADAAVNTPGTGDDKGIAYGVGANAKGIQAIALGVNAQSTTNNTIAIGENAYAGDKEGDGSGQSAIAIGREAKALKNRGVAIGDSSSADWYGTALGSRSVAAANSVAIGGGSNGSHAEASLKNSVALGTFAKTKEGVNTTEASVESNGTTLKLTDFAGTVTNDAGNKVSYVVSVGDEGKERQIQNVAAGQVTATSTDAVNGSQLHSVAAAVANMAGSVKDIIGGDATVDETGKITATDIGGTGKATLHEAIESVKNTADSLKTVLGGETEVDKDGAVTVKDLGGTGKTNVNDALKAVKTEVKAGTNVTVAESKGANGQPVYTVAVKDDLTLNSVTIGTTKVDGSGIAVDGKQFVTKDGINANNTKVTNVANGDVSANSKDAINGSQLHSVATTVANVADSVKNTADSLKAVLGKDAVVVGENGSVTVKDLGGTGKTNINDALKAVKTEVGNIESTINKNLEDINTNITNVNNKVDNINQNMGSMESRLNSRMDKAVAGSAALAALHPLEFDGNDTWSIAAGYGNYHSGNALALGAFYRPNEDTMVSLGGTVGNGEKLFNVGVSLKVGQRGHIPMTKVAMAKEIDTLKAQLEAQDQKMAMLMTAMAAK